MKNTAQIVGEVVPTAADWRKVAHRIEPGAVVTSIDGRQYRIASKVTGPDGIATFKLADLQGKPVPVPPDFHPLTPATAKLASWFRWIVAYDSNFDTYIKAFVEQAGLPVDTKVNWSKFLNKHFSPKLHLPNGKPAPEDIADEATYNAIHRVFVDERALSKCREIVERLEENPGTKSRDYEFLDGLPPDQQVTKFLVSTFLYQRDKANREIAQNYPAKGTALYQVDEEGEEYSLLDTPQHATGTEAYERVEAEMDVARFRQNFEEWLKRGKMNSGAVEKYLILFDLVWEYLIVHGERPPRRDLLPAWIARTGLSRASLRDYIKRFAELIDKYVKLHTAEIGDVHPFIYVIQKVVQERQKKVKNTAEPDLAPEVETPKSPASFGATASTNSSANWH